jgi:hypothetical protein
MLCIILEALEMCSHKLSLFFLLYLTPKVNFNIVSLKCLPSILF